MPGSTLPFRILGTILGAVIATVLVGAAPAKASTRESCRALLSTLFNSAALKPRLLTRTPVQVVYVFDVEKADPRELKHILSPPLGSRERFHLDVDRSGQLLTYVTGRIGDMAAASNEIQTMCRRENDDGFKLRTVRVIGTEIDVRSGPDAARLPQSSTITTRQ